jgi:hypothetical protein
MTLDHLNVLGSGFITRMKWEEELLTRNHRPSTTKLNENIECVKILPTSRRFGEELVVTLLQGSKLSYTTWKKNPKPYRMLIK